MLAIRRSPMVGVGAESGAQSLGYHGRVRVAIEERLLRWWRRWPAPGRKPSGLLVPLLHVKTHCQSVRRDSCTWNHMPHTHFGG
jgi:hypothetical protein